MVGVVVATHGKLAEELIQTAERVCGKLEACRAVSVEASSGMDDARARLADAIHQVDGGDGVLVLTDMFGGTPANIGLTFLDERRVEVVTGCNLPMLIKLGSARQTGSLPEIAQLITGYGQKNIVLASELLGTRREGARG